MANILIVEDEVDLAKAYQKILEAHKHKVTTAADGEIALKKIDQNVPDLILLDMRLPHMNGLEFLKLLNKKPAAVRRVAVIVFSNMDMEKDIEEAYRLGAKRYILKAWASPQHLIRIVDEQLKRS